MAIRIYFSGLTVGVVALAAVVAMIPPSTSADRATLAGAQASIFNFDGFDIAQEDEDREAFITAADCCPANPQAALC